MNKDLDTLRKVALSATQDAKFIATFDPTTVIELIDRLEKVEQAVERVREFLEYRKANSGVARDGLRALDGDTHSCAECNGTGDVQVRFAHGVQVQDCAFCFGTGDSHV